MKRSPLLLEIGCEEIPARMIQDAATDLGRRIAAILENAGLEHGAARAWGGSRRLSVRVAEVEGRQADRDERVLGPPAAIAFQDGKPGPAALGFAKKQGVPAAELVTISTDKGDYVGFERNVAGRTVGEILAERLSDAVRGMRFPKTMRWGDGRDRWVRPVHWILALHGAERLPLELFGIEATNESAGHRFLSDGPVSIAHADEYEERLEAACVMVDPVRRRDEIRQLLQRVGGEAGGEPVEDSGLLEEVADLVEWPGVVGGHFDRAYLDLPRELLITTLRHHQKCFSVQSNDGSLLPAFLAVANTDRDPGGHVQRGNEWVVTGRLDDARFFWGEDRKRSLADRSTDLERVVFHARVGTYAEKAARLERLAGAIASQAGLEAADEQAATQAARLAKNDLVTGTVGEFPELQGQVGGLLVAAEGGDETIGRAIYEHYRPEGPDDPVPVTAAGSVVSLADKLDGIVGLIGVGEVPTGSRDPIGLRRASSGIFRILIERHWPLSVRDLVQISGGCEASSVFLLERFQKFLRDRGSTPNEIRAVFRPEIDPDAALDWVPHEVVARLEAIAQVRRRADFANLVDLTKRVDNILVRNDEMLQAARAAAPGKHVEEQVAAVELAQLVEGLAPQMAESSASKSYGDVVEQLTRLIDPVHRFFEDVLVIDETNPAASHGRLRLLSGLKDLLTRYFDIRELAGQAERRQQ